ncbi:hypothetical protein WCE55_02280 [Luteimonas sp. MJ293]|uniref:hypothetical protein n=1 Tax=Luteimonas sp. MJ146 TaxID=3129240 RepID=UPI0031BB04A6
MADFIDRAQELSELHTQQSLLRHHNRAAPQQGFTRCEITACREPIEPARTRLGARLCADCAEEDRLRRAQFAGGSL